MWVKICGLTDVETARAIVGMASDAIGLNFYADSPRHVSVDVATEIARLAGDQVEVVGVFVNHSVSEIATLTEQCRLQTIQLHGAEPPEFMAELQAACPDVGLIRAHRMKQDNLADLHQYHAELLRHQVSLRAYLIDAHVKGAYGGTGQQVPWQQLADAYQSDWPPLILAGGLEPGNVRQAIATVNPWGVDVASGVESSPGQKDLSAVRQFLSEARA